MFDAGLTVRQQLHELEVTLNLDGSEQDWGIVSADGTRVAEFASFFEKNYDDRWSVYTVEEYVDLVLESAGDAIVEDPRFSVECVNGFVALAGPLVPDRFAYWTSDDWPIAPHLRSLGH